MKQRSDDPRGGRSALPSTAGLLLGLLTILAAASPARATVYRVDWDAVVPDPLFMAPGEIYGSLGEFEVLAPGDEFLLLADGSSDVTATGFSGGFPNGSYDFLEYDAIVIGAGDGLILRFDELLPEPVVSLHPVGGDLAYLSTFSQTTPCEVGGAGSVGACAILFGVNLELALFDGAIAGVYVNTPAAGNVAQAAEVTFTFTEVPEPGPGLLLGSGLIGLLALHRRRRC